MTFSPLRLRVAISTSFLILFLALPSFAVIFDEDDRLEHFEVKKTYREYARSIAAIVPLSHLEKQGDQYRWKFKQIPKLGDINIYGKRVSPDERFIHQPLCGVGTAFLIAPDVIVTAGHCVVDENGQSILRDMAVVFEYHINPQTQQVDAVVPAENVFRCERGVAIKFDPKAGTDYAIIRIDRSAQGRDPLKVRQEGKIQDNERLITIGHPFGLPSKVSINARVRSNDHDEYFRGDIDSFPGNSGSPVLNADTGMVEGILVRGGAIVAGESGIFGQKKSWRVDPIKDMLEVRRNKTADAHMVGTEVQRINQIPEVAGGYAEALALFDLIKDGKTEEALAGLKKGLDFNVKDTGRRHLMHQAMKYRNLEFAKALIELDAPILLRDVNDVTPLHEAASVGFVEGVELLIKYDHPINVVNKRGETAFWLANSANQENVVKALKDEGADTRIVPQSALLLKVQSGQLNGKQALFLASNKEEVDWLLSNAPDITDDFKEEVVGYWLYLSDQEEAMKCVIIEALVKDGTDVNRSNKDGMTGLHYATKSDLPLVVAKLIELGARVDSKTHRTKSTPLHQAAVSGSANAAKVLLDNNAEIKAIHISMWGIGKNRRENLRTPLQLSVQEGQLDVAKLLIERGAEITVRDVYDRTLLHIAADRNDVEIAAILIKAGADVNARCEYNDTPLGDTRNKNNETAKLLRKHGGIR
ncbi:MAG: ankyrin repeat domain-containing protein [Planctomycetota bacterium]